MQAVVAAVAARSAARRSPARRWWRAARVRRASAMASGAGGCGRWRALGWRPVLHAVRFVLVGILSSPPGAFTVAPCVLSDRVLLHADRVASRRLAQSAAELRAECW